MIAKELVMSHRLKQVEIAKLLGVSQPAVSLYFRERRGRAINLENESDIAAMVKNFAASLAEDELSPKAFFVTFCRICSAIRAKGSMCRLHKTFDLTINIEECGFCRL